MDKTFYFQQHHEDLGELGDAFEVGAPTAGSSYLVSNSRSVPAACFAPEIDFYLHNSRDTLAVKRDSIRRLYESRAVVFDASTQTVLTIEVGTRVLLVMAGEHGSLAGELAQRGMTVTSVAPESVASVSGHIGAFAVSLSSADEQRLLQMDQIIWPGAPETIRARRGVFTDADEATEQLIAQLEENRGSLTSPTFIRYDGSQCDLRHRRTAICGQCASLCPTGAISVDGGRHELDIADIDCIGCGRCAAVCPSGAIDFTPLPRAAFAGVSRNYTDRCVLIISSGALTEPPTSSLAENVLPLAVDKSESLDEYHLLTLLQSSGYPVLLHGLSLLASTDSSIGLINEISQRRYGRPAVIACNDENELTLAMDQAVPFPELLFDFDERSLPKRERVAKRLAHLIGEDNLGIFQADPSLLFGTISLDQQRCTLCLSCAAACNSGAMSVHTKDNTLRYTAALCTTCGYCTITCPEQGCLHLHRGHIELGPAFFQEKVLAHDELYSCTMCGREFAPAKAVNKIIAMMQPHFAGDSARLRALTCCPDCKAKVMLESPEYEHFPG